MHVSVYLVFCSISLLTIDVSRDFSRSHTCVASEAYTAASTIIQIFKKMEKERKSYVRARLVLKRIGLKYSTFGLRSEGCGFLQNLNLNLIAGIEIPWSRMHCKLFISSSMVILWKPQCLPSVFGSCACTEITEVSFFLHVLMLATRRSCSTSHRAIVWF